MIAGGILVLSNSLGWFILAPTALYVRLLPVRKLDSINDRINSRLGIRSQSGVQVALDSLHNAARDHYFRCAAKAFDMIDCLPLLG